MIQIKAESSLTIIVYKKKKKNLKNTNTWKLINISLNKDYDNN